jgi:pimeloyl-ACP methyl ester carboxylesterase
MHTPHARGFARLADLEIAYETFGDPRGPALLLVMGLGQQMLGWPEALCRMFADEGFYTIRFDNRDVGRSTRLETLPRPDIRALYMARLAGQEVVVPYTLDDMAQDALGLLDFLGVERAHVLGASMGGMLGQVLALKHPERVQTLTSFMSTTGDKRLPGPKPLAMSLMVMPPALTWPEHLRNSQHVWRCLAGSRFHPPAAYVEQQARLFWERGLYPAGFVRHLGAILSARNRTKALAELRPPLLVIHGTEDPLIPVEAGKLTAKSAPQARLHLIEGLGHLIPPAIWPVLVDEVAAHAGV